MIKRNILVVALFLLANIAIHSQTPTAALEIDTAGVVNVESKIKNSNGNTYDPLPIGTILMFSGNDWVDNVTLPGWYACTVDAVSGAVKNIDGILVPNLVDSFIRGGDPTNWGVTSGSNSITLTTDQMPNHTHNIDHDHARFDGMKFKTRKFEYDRGGNKQSQGISVMSDIIHNRYNFGISADSWNSNEGHFWFTALGFDHSISVSQERHSSFSKRVPVSESIVTPVINLPPLSTGVPATIHGQPHTNKDYTSGPAGNNHAIDIRPKNYTVIYIMKVKN